MARQPADAAFAALERAAKAVPASFEEAKELAEGFAAEVAAAVARPPAAARRPSANEA